MSPRDLLQLLVASTALLPTDSHIAWSPGNVRFDQDSAVITQNSSYFKTGFTGTSIALTVDVGIYRHNSIPTDGWGQWVVSVDGSAPVPVVVPEPAAGSDTTTVILARGLGAGRHNLQSWFDLRDETDTYAPKDAQSITAVVLDPGATLQSPTGACALLPDRMMIMGDSITKGYRSADPSGASSSSNYPLSTFAATLGQALHCEYGIVGESGQGWAHNSNAWNEVFPIAYTNYSTGKPRIWPRGLKYLVVAEGTNDSGGISSAVEAWLPKARTIVGRETWIILVAPFNDGQTSQLEMAATNYKSSSGDGRVAVVAPSSVLSTATSGTFYTVDGTHPPPLLHPLFGAILAAQITQATAPASSPSPPR